MKYRLNRDYLTADETFLNNPNWEVYPTNNGFIHVIMEFDYSVPDLGSNLFAFQLCEVVEGETAEETVLNIEEFKNSELNIENV
jgi:hypothetical protein